MGDILQAVQATVGFVCDVPVDQLTEATRLADIGADSLARVAIADQVEARLGAARAGWRIPDDTLARVTTVGELADAVVRLRGPAEVDPVASR